METMKRFSINSNNLKDRVLFDLIQNGSRYFQKIKPKKYYTCNGEPANWKWEYRKDKDDAEKIQYMGNKYKVLKTGDGNVLCIFHKKHVYSPDSYYSDCPILAEILKY